MSAIAREDGPTGGRYVLRLDGLEAELTYSRASPTLIIAAHTGVPEALRGRGLAERLAEGARIVPLCPFVNAWRRAHPDWADVFAV